MSPFFTLQRQLSYEPQRRLPVAVVVGTPPDPQRAREKLLIEALHTKLSYFRSQPIGAPHPARQFGQHGFYSILFGCRVLGADDDRHDDRDHKQTAAAAYDRNQYGP